jgi:hypothetical protein
MRSLFLLLGVVFAGPNAFAALLEVDNLNFGAPVVNDRTDFTTSNPIGTIVYDHSDSAFYGLSPSGSWLQLGQSAATPTRCQYYTEGTSSSTHGTSTTGSHVRRFSTSPKVNTGSCITHTDNGTDGSYFTVAAGKGGIYSITYTDGKSTGQERIGITIDSTVFNAVIQNVTYAQGKRTWGYSGTTAAVASVSIILPLTDGQVIRGQDESSADLGANSSSINIVRIAD